MWQSTPGVAAILGSSIGVELSDRVINTPSYSLRVVKHWRHASTNLDYHKGVSPGNGFVLTSMSETVSAGFQYSLRNQWSLSVQSGWMSLSAVSSTANSYSSYMADVALSHVIRPGVQAVATFGARPFTYVGPAIGNRTSYIAQVGLSFSPQPKPIVLR